MWGTVCCGECGGCTAAATYEDAGSGDGVDGSVEGRGGGDGVFSYYEGSSVRRLREALGRAFSQRFRRRKLEVAGEAVTFFLFRGQTVKTVSLVVKAVVVSCRDGGGGGEC